MNAKRHITLKILSFLVLTDIIETFAQFCFKKSAIPADFLGVNHFSDGILFIKTVLPSPFLWMGLVSVIFIFTIWSTILSKIDLSVAVPVASFSYITVPLVSTIFLHERISILRWCGIFFILLGIILVSFSSKRKESHA